MKAGDERYGQEALDVHLPPQEEVPLKVMQAEVVLTAHREHSKFYKNGLHRGSVECERDKGVLAYVMVSKFYCLTR